MYWLNVAYAQSMVKANVRLPMSMRNLSLMMACTSGLFLVSEYTTRAENANVQMNWFMANTTGNMLLAQVGSRDITQSVTRKVPLSAQTNTPGPLMPRSLRNA